jgi:hypothetical protein
MEFHYIDSYEKTFCPSMGNSIYASSPGVRRFNNAYVAAKAIADERSSSHHAC